MIVEMVKLAGGVFTPVDDEQADALKRFRTGEQYSVEIKLLRNPAFHRKVFAFFKFCFEHWAADKTEWEHFDARKQFDTFRKHLTVLAGFYETTYNINGGVRIEAQSLSYGNMEQDEFESCYKALISAAIKHIFGNTTDKNTLNQLYAFFW